MFCPFYVSPDFENNFSLPLKVGFYHLKKKKLTSIKIEA
jgi:hypothetical protein